VPLTLPPDPRRIFAESEHWAALLNTNQDLLGRCFLVLKRPETDVAALSDAEVTDLWALVRRVRAKLDTLWSPDHYNYAFLMNLDPQVHFHVVPRYRSERTFAGHTFVDPHFGGHYDPANERALNDAGCDAVLAALRAAGGS
jgi:diadenosine tetraphosphate (Ap4A) HIT family hydrolase